MHAPYRIAATREPEPPDPADDYEAELRGGARRGRQRSLFAMVVAGLGVAAASMWRSPPPPPAPDPAAAVRVELDQVRAHAAAQRRKLIAAVEAAHARNAEGTEPCPTVLPEATRLHPRAFPFTIALGEPRTWASPSVDRVFADAARAEAHLVAGRALDGALHAKAVAASRHLTHEVVVVPDAFTPPVGKDARTFQPGEIAGRAYLYDFAAGRVTCAGDVYAKSSRRVEYTYADGAPTIAPRRGLVSSLDVDLDVRLQRDIAESLFSVEPM